MKRNIEKREANGSALLRLISLTVILAFIAPAMINAQAGKTNFAGDWTLNAEKSTQPQGGQGGGGGMRMGGGNFVATQEANLLTVVRTRTGQDGTATTTTTKYTLDGKECVNTTPRGDSKSTATWSPDFKSLTIVTKASFNGNDMTITAVWSLIDAKTLSIKTSRPGQDGAITTTTAVYEIK